MVSNSEVTVAVLFTSSVDATGHYKKITINITDDNIDAVQSKAEAQAGRLHNIDSRTWTWSLPMVTV